MSEFKRGDKVQVQRSDGFWLDGYEYVGRTVDAKAYRTVIDGDGYTLTCRASDIRRAPRVVTQMCQWWVVTLGDQERLRALPIYESNADIGRKVGEPFEQTLEIPE